MTHMGMGHILHAADIEGLLAWNTRRYIIFYQRLTKYSRLTLAC